MPGCRQQALRHPADLFWEAINELVQQEQVRRRRDRERSVRHERRAVGRRRHSAARRRRGQQVCGGSVGGCWSCFDGSWTNGRLSFAYQWRRDGTPVQAGTGDTHAVQTCDQGADADVCGRDVERRWSGVARNEQRHRGRGATLPARDRQPKPKLARDSDSRARGAHARTARTAALQLRAVQVRRVAARTELWARCAVRGRLGLSSGADPQRAASRVSPHWTRTDRARRTRN